MQDAAVDHQRPKLVGQRLDLRRLERPTQAQHQVVADVALRVEVAVKVADVPRRRRRVVGDEVQVSVLGADPAVGQQRLFDVVVPVVPVVAARGVDHHDRHQRRLAGLHQGQRFKALVLRAEAAGEQGHRVGHPHEHELAGEEVAEGHQLWVAEDHVVGVGLKGQADRHAEGRLTARAAVARAHDPVAGPGDDHPARLRHGA